MPVKAVPGGPLSLDENRYFDLPLILAPKPTGPCSTCGKEDWIARLLLNGAMKPRMNWKCCYCYPQAGTDETYEYTSTEVSVLYAPEK